MKLNLGDKIRFLHTPQTGVIMHIEKNNMAEIEIEEGFRVKVPLSELVKDYSSPDDFTKPIKTHPSYIQKTKKIKVKKIKASSSVDLHFADARVLNLSNGEIVEIQLKKLSSAIIKAMSENTRELIIIHGVGTGTLKTKIHEYLQGNRYIKSISQADPFKYGMGATKVTF